MFVGVGTSAGSEFQSVGRHDILETVSGASSSLLKYASSISNLEFDLICGSKTLTNIKAFGLKTDVTAPTLINFSGHTTLIVLPENQVEAQAMITQYGKCKRNFPHTTAACFVAPMFNRFHATLLTDKGFKLKRNL